VDGDVMKSIMACASVGGTFKVIDNFEGCEQLAYEHIDDFFKIARSRRGVFQGCFAKRYNQDEGHYVYLYKGPQSAETSAAECDYYIAVLETMNPAAFRDENLDSTLQLFAPTDIEVVNAMKNKKADFTRQKANPIPQFSLDKKILTAILDGCMARAINRCEPVDISLPDENFEQTMRQVIKTIYSYMPYRLRAFSGYITSTETWAFPEFSSLRFYRNSDRQELVLVVRRTKSNVSGSMRTVPLQAVVTGSEPR
jgi:hypothetical protein